MQKKIDILNKLRLLIQNGVKLNKNFNLDSDYDEMLFEYEFNTNPQFRQQVLNEIKQSQNESEKMPSTNNQISNINSNDQNAQLIKKQEQMKRESVRAVR